MRNLGEKGRAMSKRSLTSQVEHNPFWQGFWAGMSGPMQMVSIASKPLRVPLDAGSVKNAWNGVGKHISVAFEKERGRVAIGGTARSKQGKIGEFR